MPRSAEQNALVRDERKKQILDAALTVYIRCGYHGADTDIVAREAKLAKGLVYYYFKTKQELFAELFLQQFSAAYTFSQNIEKDLNGMNAVDALMTYCAAMFGAGHREPRMMQFCMRFPFDAYAVFSPDEWKEAAKKSDVHRVMLSSLIARGIEEGTIPPCSADSSANSFWTVFAANMFQYSRLITGCQDTPSYDSDTLRNVVQFCFQGLGIRTEIWNESLQNSIQKEKNNERIPQ
jgi:AcrR family transcriptional regulator